MKFDNLIRQVLSEEINKLVINELKNASYDNSEYIEDMLYNGYLAHGTTVEDVDSFDEQYIKGGCRGEYGYGFYFTNELYKCLEYGSNIIFTPQKAYHFLDLDGYGEFKKIIESHEDKLAQISKCQNALDYCRSNQEYDYYTNQLEELKSQIPDNSDTIIHLIRKGIESDYDDESIYKCVLGNSLVGTLPQVSKFLLDMGYDGVVCGNQYCIFNFKKLNQNLYY